MNQYEKLCEAAGIQAKMLCDCSFRNLYLYSIDYGIDVCPYMDEKYKKKIKCEKNCKYGKLHIPDYPAFTESKQLELIKLLISVFKLELWQMRSLENSEYASMAYNRIVYNNDFSETIAGLALELLKNNQLNREEIKKILTGT